MTIYVLKGYDIKIEIKYSLLTQMVFSIAFLSEGDKVDRKLINSDDNDDENKKTSDKRVMLIMVQRKKERKD